MPIRVDFELEDDELEQLRRIMRDARERARVRPEREVTRGARDLLADRAGKRAPRFVRERLAVLRSLVVMLDDDDWALEGEDRERVLGAVAYFNESDDLIPDDVPGVGLLDDAIVIELIRRELEHELAAYEEFCTHRDAWSRRGVAPSREKWLRDKRRALLERMRSLRERRGAPQPDDGRPSGRQLFSLW